MSVPGAVQAALGDEQVAARVSLGGEDELYVTPTRTLIYRGEGLLSDESIEEYPHDAERITVSDGRRKTTVTLEYPIDGPSEFAVPSDRLQDALHPVVAGVLNAASITEPGERVTETFRFSELTLVVTSDRLVKHVGEAVWGDGHEEFHFGDVTDLSFEEGSVATQVVLEVDGRPQRIKAPNDQAEKVRQTLQEALFAYHDVGSLAELRRALGSDEDDEEADDEGDDPVAFGGGVDPLGSAPSTEADDAGTAGDAGAAADAGGTDDQGGAATDAGGQVAEVAAGDDAGGAADLLDPDGGEDALDAIADAGAGGSDDAGAAADAEAGGGAATDAGTAATAAADPAVAEELAALREAVEEQNRRLEDHQEVLKSLVERLSGGQ